MKLTKAQLQIYNMDLFVGSSISNVCGSILFSGHRDIEFLKDTVNKLFEINDGLRIQLYEDEHGINQRIQPFTRSDVQILEFSDYEEFSHFAEEYAKKPLTRKDILCEIPVIILPGKYGILPKMHHLIGDAWAIALIGNQFNELISNKTPAAFSFADYIEKEQEYLKSKRHTRDASFFESQIKNFESPVYISDFDNNNFSAMRKTIEINKVDAERIKKFVNDTNTSVFSVFFSVLSIYLSNAKNAEKLCIGTTVLNRSGIEEKNTIGSFINAVPVFIDLNKEYSFSENFEAVESSLLSTLRHQKYNYQFALENFRKNGVKQQKPFDVILSYQNTKILGDFEESKWYHNGVQIESLQIHIEDRDNTGAFKIHYDYQTEKFTEEDIENLHNHLYNLLFDVLENPEKKISDLEILSPAEKQKLLYDFNATAHSYDIPESSTICSLFEKTAKEHTDKICIKTAEKAVTFGELLNLSENLDAEIRNITNGNKSVIAVIAERSIEMYAAIYGIIRGGNSYLPIDPDYPQDRIDYILQNSNAAAVLAQDKFTHLAKNVPLIDTTEFIGRTEKGGNIPSCAATENDTAYVIYTSGSTGTPKGAKISHKSAINRILWMHDKYPLKNEDVILQKTPYTFDVSVWELFWWGICGGSLAISKPGEHFLPAKILDETHKNKVTHIHFVPSVFELFLNYLENHTDELYKFNSVRYVFLSGEALTANLIQRFYKLYDYEKITLHNLYGPTECAVDVTYYDCTPTDIDPVPIGKPIYNTQMYVVDKHIKPVPMGVTGELCIAGMNVGQGYLNNPDLTAEKFIDNPFGEGKLYRTGDNAYFREDGQLIFCGRIDGQIKLNGQRVETGEIEAVISSVTGVESVAVVIRKIGQRDTLVAFYSGKRDREIRIKDACREKLPKYMIPSFVVHLDSIPLNQSGKLDRKALVKTELNLYETEAEVPVNDTERHICKIFEDILGEKNIGRNSDFFEVGGTSFSMISLLSEEGFESVTAAEFIRNPTPALLASVIKKKKVIATEYLEPLYVPKDSKQLLILLPFAGGGAEAYSNFMVSLKKHSKDTAVYFIRYLHSVRDCKKAADEINAVHGNSEILFYSHCVGSALALQIISCLEKENVTVKHYFAAASIPPSKPTERNIWNRVPDIVLRHILLKAGAKLKNLPDENLTLRLKQFRNDTDFANIAFVSFDEKIKTPVSVILSKTDMFTSNYKHAELLWKRHTENVKDIFFINSDSHYFQSENSDELVEIMFPAE